MLVDKPLLLGIYLDRYAQTYPRAPVPTLVDVKKAYQSMKNWGESFLIRSIRVFGSLSRGDAHPQSDIDLAIEFAKSASFDLREKAFDVIRDYNWITFHRASDLLDWDAFPDNQQEQTLLLCSFDVR